MTYDNIQELFYPKVVTNYFEDIAKKFLEHTKAQPRFARNYTDFTEKVIGQMPLNKIVMVLDERSGQMTDNLHGAFFDIKTLSFFLLAKVSNDNFEQEDDTYQDAYEKMMKIIQHLYKDRITFECATMMQFLDTNSIRYDQVGPEYENTFGLLVRLQFKVPSRKVFLP